MWYANFLCLRPRVILVEDRGSLVGLLTVKDCLMFTLMQQRREYRGTWFDEESVHGLEDSFDNIWLWTMGVVDSLSVVHWMKRIMRR
jgi:chloride channel 3/4/5